MVDMCRYLQTLGKLVLLFLIAGAVATPTLAQTEVQIMASGSWDFVEEPAPEKDPTSAGQALDRIVLIAPHDDSHAFYIFSGDNATKFAATNPPPSITDHGIYYFDIQNLIPSAGHKPQTSDTLPLNWSNLQPVAQPVSISKIRSVLYTPANQRFAVSLPKPDYYTTYSGAWGPGLSESKVDVLPISNQSPSKFTTWMVLHYWVSAAPKAILTARLDKDFTHPVTLNAPAFSIDSNGATTATVSAISIVMGAAGTENDFSCDSISQSSFDLSSKLWNWTRFARFPEEDKSGNQHQGIYHSCSGMKAMAAGSADCHKGQGSINGAVQNP